MARGACRGTCVSTSRFPTSAICTSYIRYKSDQYTSGEVRANLRAGSAVILVMTIFASKPLPSRIRPDRCRWRQNGGEWHLLARGRAIARVVPDATWLKMYRVVLTEGSLSDLVNLTRVKDAAFTLATPENDRAGTQPEASSIAQNDEGAVSGLTKRAPARPLRSRPARVEVPSATERSCRYAGPSRRLAPRS
jgi:hypothetical protein